MRTIEIGLSGYALIPCAIAKAYIDGSHTDLVLVPAGVWEQLFMRAAGSLEYGTLWASWDGQDLSVTIDTASYRIVRERNPERWGCWGAGIQLNRIVFLECDLGEDAPKPVEPTT